MNGIEDAQQRWQDIRSAGRKKGIAALVGIIILVFIIALVAKGNATLVLLVAIAIVVVLGAIALLLGKRQTGLSITPEWKPKDDRTFDDDGFSPDPASPPIDPKVDADEPTEPVRRLDAQILGTDLSKLGQVVNPKLNKTYAMGYLELLEGKLAWQPSVATTSQGIETLTAAPTEVASVQRAPLWGSWALVRVLKTDGTEWCLRVPGSVDLAPAFGELGLTLQTIES